MPVLTESYQAFETAYKFLCAKGDSRSAMKRPAYPSCVLPGLLYLGDLADAASLPRLREHLGIEHCVTALAELTPTLKAAVAESGVKVAPAARVRVRVRVSVGVGVSVSVGVRVRVGVRVS